MELTAIIFIIFIALFALNDMEQIAKKLIELIAIGFMELSTIDKIQYIRRNDKSSRNIC